MGILRLVGKVLNVIALFLIIILNFVEFTDYLIVNIITAVALVYLMGQFYIEKEFFDDKRLLFILLGIILPLGVSAWLLLTSGVPGTYFLLIMLVAEYTVPFYQHYTLSIYKNEKKMYILFFVVFEAVSSLVNITIFSLLLFLVQILMVIATVMVFAVESKMKKKKLLNYI